MEHSYGIIPLRRRDRFWETLLVKHRKGHWAFPKGHSDPDETPQETASRELYEETGLRVMRLFALEPLREFYIYKLEGSLIEKSVTYFLAEVEGEVRLQAEEIEAFSWVSLQEAARLATFPEAKKLARQLMRQFPEQSGGSRHEF